MAEVFKESCDHFTSTTHLFEKWGLGVATGLSIGAFGRNSTNGLRIDAGGVSQTTGYVQLALANLATTIVGFALKGTGTDRPLIRFLDNTTEQCSVWLRSDGRLEARGPGGSLAVGTEIISSTVHKYVEIKATISDAAGRIIVKINGATTDIDTGGGGVDTKSTANAYVTAVRFGYGLGSAETTSYVYDFDDIYGVQDDFQGDVRIECIRPSGTGASAQFTPSAGANWENVDDTAPDDDTTYNGSATVGHVDSVALGNLVTATGTVISVTAVTRMRKEDAGARTARSRLYLSTASSTTQESSDFSPATAYGFFRQTERLDGDALAWSITKVNALEIGYEVQA
jgi:hypothetical protein